MHQPLLNTLHPDEVNVVIQRVDEAEVDAMWSYVEKKSAPRWLWHAIDHQTGKVLAYVFGRRQDHVFHDGTEESVVPHAATTGLEVLQDILETVEAYEERQG